MKLPALMTFLGASLTTLPALAQEAAAEGGDEGFSKALIACAAAVVMSVCVFAGTIAQGKTATTALEGIARNPGAQKQIFTPMILCLALIESLVIYGLIIAFILTGKI